MSRRSVASLAVAAVIAAVIGWACALRHDDRGVAHAAAIDLPPAAAYDTATALMLRKEYRASLPYYRYALSRLRDDHWSPHVAFAVALGNATLGYTTRCGVMVPETRSSAERVQLMQEAFAHLERAAQLAPDGPTRARILGAGANLFFVHGFSWDALIAYRQAHDANPRAAVWARDSDALRDMLHDPVHATRAPSPPDSVAARP